MKTQSQSWFKESWKRWLAWFLIATVFAIACVFLSQWQFARRTEALAKIAKVVENYDQLAIPVEQIINSDSLAPGNEWRQVSLTGHFLIADAVLVRNRPNNGQPGFLQLIPFETEAGDIFAVETGWIPTGDKQDYPDTVPLPNDRQQEIIARLRPAEPSLNRDAPAHQIATINIDSLIEKTSVDPKIYKTFYLSLAQKYNSQKLPLLSSRPEITEGNHLSYALQWILFALMAFAALWWAIRQELKARRIALDPNYVPRKRVAIGDLDKAAEDEVVS